MSSGRAPRACSASCGSCGCNEADHEARCSTWVLKARMIARARSTNPNVHTQVFRVGLRRLRRGGGLLLSTCVGVPRPKNTSTPPHPTPPQTQTTNPGARAQGAAPQIAALMPGTGARAGQRQGRSARQIGFRVWGLGFIVYRVWGLGFRANRSPKTEHKPTPGAGAGQARGGQGQRQGSETHQRCVQTRESGIICVPGSS